MRKGERERRGRVKKRERENREWEREKERQIKRLRELLEISEGYFPQPKPNLGRRTETEELIGPEKVEED